MATKKPAAQPARADGALDPADREFALRALHEIFKTRRTKTGLAAQIGAPYDAFCEALRRHEAKWDFDERLINCLEGATGARVKRGAAFRKSVRRALVDADLYERDLAAMMGVRSNLLVTHLKRHDKIWEIERKAAAALARGDPPRKAGKQPPQAPNKKYTTS